MLLQTEHSRRLAFTSRTEAGERLGIVVAGAQDVKGKPLRGLAADARQFFQFVDEPGHRLGKFRHDMFVSRS